MKEVIDGFTASLHGSELRLGLPRVSVFETDALIKCSSEKNLLHSI